jgi:hypothetical protein
VIFLALPLFCLAIAAGVFLIPGPGWRPPKAAAVRKRAAFLLVGAAVLPVLLVLWLTDALRGERGASLRHRAAGCLTPERLRGWLERRHYHLSMAEWDSRKQLGMVLHHSERLVYEGPMEGWLALREELWPDGWAHVIEEFWRDREGQQQ